MIVYGIIPARGGSKRIAHKNVALLRGKPLIEYTIRAAQESKCLERIIVSTDCGKTANIAAELGVQVVMRPEHIADGAGHYEARIAANCLESLTAPDAVLWLQPTSPMRSPEWIARAVQRMEDTQCDSVVTYVDATDSGYYQLTRSGDIYLTKTGLLLSGDLYGKNIEVIVIPRERYCNINEPVDLKIAEALL